MKTPCSTAYYFFFVLVVTAVTITSTTATILVACDKKCDNDAHKLFAACMEESDSFLLDINGLSSNNRYLRKTDLEHRGLQSGECSVCEVANPDPICCIIPWCQYTCSLCQTCGTRRQLGSADDMAGRCEEMFDDFCKADKGEEGDKVTCTATVYDESPKMIAQDAFVTAGITDAQLAP